jgi:hypothetical protein
VEAIADLFKQFFHLQQLPSALASIGRFAQGKQDSPSFKDSCVIGKVLCAVR